jgi:hypothetical protein
MYEQGFAVFAIGRVQADAGAEQGLLPTHHKAFRGSILALVGHNGAILRGGDALDQDRESIGKDSRRLIFHVSPDPVSIRRQGHNGQPERLDGLDNLQELIQIERLGDEAIGMQVV